MNFQHHVNEIMIIFENLLQRKEDKKSLTRAEET